MKSNKLFNELLARTGGWYIIIVFALAQLLVFPGASFGLISIQINAEFTIEQLRQISTPIPWLIFSANLILLIIVWLMSSVARKRLDAWKQETRLSRGTDDEILAWKQITGITWRYGFIAFFRVNSLLCSYRYCEQLFTRNYFLRSGHLLPDGWNRCCNHNDHVINSFYRLGTDPGEAYPNSPRL